ncbi:MAG: hypothetical protein M1829_002836 [Trizodia sp. TS-e1964]|nr:MAG: hypothetical protein M1829_002836 [Trizodia sp. TS-e1964]
MSSNCHDEHGHGHGHDDNSHGSHDHTDDIMPALEFFLYQHVDFDKIITLNEAEPMQGQAVVKKTWAQRLESQPELESDADEQLLMFVPFTGQVKLHSLLIRTSASTSAPKTLKVFVNRDDLDFSNVPDLPATQTFSLAQTADVQEIPVKRAVFNATQSLMLFFEENFGMGDEDITHISYIGFKGEWMRLNKEGVSTLYEAAAQPGDHKLVQGTGGLVGRDIGG